MQLLPTQGKLSLGITLLIAIQLGCAAFFLADIIADFAEESSFALAQPHFMLELTAAISMGFAILLEIRYIGQLHEREARLARNVAIASSAMSEVIQGHFAEWQLTPAEHDVALFLIKGFSIAEIARLRGSAEGTVKAHLNAIYKKSGAHSRAEVLSIFIDAVMSEPLLDADETGQAESPAAGPAQSG